jgi:hypothetical protein
MSMFLLPEKGFRGVFHCYVDFGMFLLGDLVFIQDKVPGSRDFEMFLSGNLVFILDKVPGGLEEFGIFHS